MGDAEVLEAVIAAQRLRDKMVDGRCFCAVDFHQPIRTEIDRTMTEVTLTTRARPDVSDVPVFLVLHDFMILMFVRRINAARDLNEITRPLDSRANALW